MCYVLIRDIRLLSFRSREVFLFMLGAKLRQKNFVRRQNALQVYYIGVLGEVRGGTYPRAPLALPQLRPWNIVMMNLINNKPIRPIVTMDRPHQKTWRQKMRLQKMDLQPHFKKVAINHVFCSECNGIGIHHFSFPLDFQKREICSRLSFKNSFHSTLFPISW